MAAHHWESVPIEKLASLPTFCAPILKDGDPSIAVWIDFWAVEPYGNAEADYERGQHYGEEAIVYMHDYDQPAFIECVMIFMGKKLHDSRRCQSPLELGFFDRVVKDYPDVMEKIFMRIFKHHPEVLN
jgi:hypothetical protein